MIRRFAWCGTNQSIASAVSPGVGEAALDHVGHHADGVAEHLLAFHPEMADRLGRRGAAVDVELGAVAPVRPELRGDDAGRVGRTVALARLQHDRARPVAEQHAGRTVAPVEDAGESLRADHQRPLVRPGDEELVGRRDRVDEAGADRLQVEGRALDDAEIGLDLGRDRGKGVVGGRRSPR